MSGANESDGALGAVYERLRQLTLQLTVLELRVDRGEAGRLLYSRKQAARMLGISVDTVGVLIHRGDLKVRVFGRRTLIPRRELEKLVSRDIPQIWPMKVSGRTVRPGDCKGIAGGESSADELRQATPKAAGSTPIPRSKGSRAVPATEPHTEDPPVPKDPARSIQHCA